MAAKREQIACGNTALVRLLSSGHRRTVVCLLRAQVACLKSMGRCINKRGQDIHACGLNGREVLWLDVFVPSNQGRQAELNPCWQPCLKTGGRPNGGSCAFHLHSRPA
jgi:hypothetical protein